jgi:hypothetical protein
MPATRKTQAGTSSPPSTAESPGGRHRHLGHGRRLRSGAVPHGPPDVGAMAREAVISFLRDASKATADRETVRAGVAAAGAEAAVTAAAGNPAGDGASKADGILAAAPEPAAMPRDAISAASRVAGHAGAESVAWRAAAISVAALDRIEAAAAKVEADIAVALRAYADLQAGAGAAAEAAVRAAQAAMAAAGVAMEAERQVKISLHQVRQYVVVTVILLVVVIIVLAVASSPVH